MQGKSGGIYEGHVRAWIAAAIMLYFWIGTQPFRDLGEATAASSLLPQLILVTISASALASQLFMLRTPWPGLGTTALLIGWMLVAALAAGEPALALRNTLVQVLIMVIAYLSLKLPDSEARFARILSGAAVVAVMLSYFGVIFLPQLAIHQVGDIAEPMLAGDWRGHFPHKNFTAPAMAVAVFCAIYLYSLGRRRLAVALGIASVIFLFNTGGKTGLAILPAILLAVWMIERCPALRWPIVLGAVIAFNAVLFGATVSRDFAETLTSWGVDATFTNRVDIWRIALGLISDISPFGLGLNTFWGSPHNLFGGWEIESWAYVAGSAHNGYIDLWINLGLPGMVLFLFAFVVMPLVRMKTAIVSNPDSAALTRFFMHVWLFGLINACMESVFFSRSGVMWFAFLLASFGILFQARASIVATVKNPLPARALRYDNA